MEALASLAQVIGVDALRLITMIVKSSHNAKMHRKNCQQIAYHIKMIGNLLEKLKPTELRNLQATREPLDGLEEALKKTLDLVESCRKKSYLYLIAMGWSVVNQFRQAQEEIDRYLTLIPLIALVHHQQQIQERLRAIEEDERQYGLDPDDEASQKVIMKPGHTKEDVKVLERSLSRRYPDLGFDEALLEENDKLHQELEVFQVKNDPEHCTVIEHLIEVTENIVPVHPVIKGRNQSLRHTKI